MLFGHRVRGVEVDKTYDTRMSVDQTTQVEGMVEGRGKLKKKIILSQLVLVYVQTKTKESSSKKFVIEG